MTTKKISKQDAIDQKLFGPVYHGTNVDARDSISKDGFKIYIGPERSEKISNGFQASSYADGKPAPIHMIGYGVYFTTSKTIAKSFNGDSAKGLKEYYLKVPKLETINFGSQSNMMKWWVKNGYDMPTIYPLKDGQSDKDVAQLRLEATKHLTDSLKSKWDAVWFKGKGLRKLLDGDQICVFDPANIYEVDSSIVKEWDIGSKVRRKSDGMTGVIKQIYMDEHSVTTRRKLWNEQNADKEWWVKPDTKKVFSVKWQKGGTEYNVQDVDIEPVAPKGGFKKQVESKYKIERRDG